MPCRCPFWIRRSSSSLNLRKVACSGGGKKKRVGRQGGKERMGREVRHRGKICCSEARGGQPRSAAATRPDVQLALLGAAPSDGLGGRHHGPLALLPAACVARVDEEGSWLGSPPQCFMPHCMKRVPQRRGTLPRGAHMDPFFSAICCSPAGRGRQHHQQHQVGPAITRKRRCPATLPTSSHPSRLHPPPHPQRSRPAKGPASAPAAGPAPDRGERQAALCGGATAWHVSHKACTPAMPFGPRRRPRQAGQERAQGAPQDLPTFLPTFRIPLPISSFALAQS